jgi:hypothetical protein
VSSFGYRLFEIHLRERNGHKDKEMSDVAGVHLAELVASVIDNQLMARTVVGMPDAAADDTPPDEDPNRNKPGMQITACKRIGHQVHVDVLYGRYSDFRRALRPPGSAEPDAELDGLAPAREYRLILNFPPKGTKGVLIAEDIGRSCPVKMFIRWFRHASQEEAVSLGTAAAAGNSDPEKAAASAVWHRLAAYPMSDPGHLKKLIDDGLLDRVELTKTSIGKAGTPSKRGMELTVSDLKPKHQAALAALAIQWSKRKFAPDDEEGKKAAKITDADGARSLATILGDDIAILDFDDGYLVLKEGGKSKNISPSRLSDLFIYPIDRDRQPSRVAFYERGRDTAKSLAKSSETASLEWPPLEL